MSYAQSITIGPRFFQKAFNDYNNKYWAFAREILQNSLDCGSTRINIRVELADDATRVDVENNGAPMDHATLTGKLLSLGESGKDFQGAVGGFGKAKEILYFAHRAYSIRTGTLRVHGSGAGYDIESAGSYLHGTVSTVWWEGSHADHLNDAFERFIHQCGMGTPPVRFFLNGDAVRPKHHPGELARTLGDEGNPWAEVRLTKVERGRLIVRIGGIPMFWERCDYKGTVVLELLGTSGERLTANRDGLKYPYSNQLREFITAIAVDQRSAFVREKAEYRRYAGVKLRRPQAESGESATSAAHAWATAAQADVGAGTGGAGILVDIAARTEAPKPGLLGHEFIVKNCVNKPVPAEYDPESLAFSDYAHWLVRAWAGCLLELHDLFGVDDPFSVGFIFADQTVAESESSHEYGQVYYLNPCHVTRKGYTRRFKKASRHAIQAAAAHEFVHGALREGYHGEDFASKLTEAMALVLQHSRRFTRHLG